MTEAEKQCTHLIFYDQHPPGAKEIKKILETGSDEEKYEALQKVILLHMNGESQQKLLMTIIRYVLPTTYKPLKKLLLYFWEIIDKSDKNGKLLPEMILVCNYLRNDLTHPNEYIRGITLRFLCKLRQSELLEPLIKPIVQNLEHRHSYVRRNAVLAVFSIYQQFEHLIPDAPERVEQFLEAETDVTSKRNAFIMLFHCDQERAVRYVRSILNQVSTVGESLQLAILHLLRQMCKKYPNEKSQYLRVISSLLDSKSNAVLYQCAGTLVSLSTSPAAIRASARCYIQLLLSKQSDTNIKLIVLDRLVDLKNRFPDVMQQVVMELLRGLSLPSMDIKKKVLNIVLDLVNSRNVEEILNTFKKEIQKPPAEQQDKKAHGEYKKLLVHSFHQCALKFPEVAKHVVSIIDYIGDQCGTEVILFTRDIIEICPDLRDDILKKLCSVFTQINSARVFRIALWILGDFSETPEQISNSMDCIINAIGELKRDEKEEEKTTEGIPTGEKSRILNPDGTYATQTIIQATSEKKITVPKVISLRSLIMEGNFYLASVACTALTKLAMKLQSIEMDESERNQKNAMILRIMCSVVRIGTTGDKPSYRIDKDTYDRICLCIRLLVSKDEITRKIFLEESRKAFSNILKEQRDKERQEWEAHEKEKVKASQVDSLLNITQLKGKKFDVFDFEEEDVFNANKSEKNNASRLGRIIQLTGFSDPVYAEATVTLHQFDIVLDVLVVNQTNDTLQNLTLELATVGDLKLCERPQNYTLGPFASQHIKASIKVSSTETGIIFGNIVYDVSGAGNESHCVILNDVHIDIMDYIAPSTCDDIQFRTMWFEFEWENKIPVNYDGNCTLREFLDHITKITNMNCLTPESALSGDCEFLSANLYAKSSFGEDALANVSIEKSADGKITGFVRIRSKTQGIALSLGERITKEQKSLEKGIERD